MRNLPANLVDEVAIAVLILRIERGESPVNGGVLRITSSKKATGPPQGGWQSFRRLFQTFCSRFIS